MISVPRSFAIRYALDGIEYTATVKAWNALDARELLADRLASTISALPRGASYRVLSVTAC